MPRDYDDDDDLSPDRILMEAKSKVNAGGIGLIVTGVIAALSIVYGIATYPTLDDQRDEQIAQFDKDPNMDAKTKQMQKDLLTQYYDGAKIGLPVVYLIAMSIAAITILAGVRVRQLRSPGIVKTGAILSMLPLPCVSGCCLLGLIFGIITLSALKDPIVKRGFEITARRNDPNRDDFEDRNERPEE